MPANTIRLFGYPQITAGETHLRVERRKTLALVAYLAVNRQGCGRESLAALFWPEHPPEQAASYLRQALWDFSKAGAQDWIVKEGPVLSLNPAMDIWVDSIAFEQKVADWKALVGQPQIALTTLKEAADLVLGDFLAGFTLRDCPAFDEWQSQQTERLRLRYGQILESLVRQYASQQNHPLAIQQAQRWLELDPFNEAAHRALMQLYQASGQRNAALHQYENCRQLLRNELGVEPEAETAALERQIRSEPAPFLSTQQLPTAPARPTGLVTFLFTDIEGSTRLWEHHPQAMPNAHRRQEMIIRQAMVEHGGYVYKMIGDAFQVAFATTDAALRAALAAQRALQTEDWGEIGRLKVRMGLHTCVTEERPDDYVGPNLNRAARIMSAGHGGQVLLSQVVYEQVCGKLPQDVSLYDLGQWLLKDLVQAEHLYQLTAPGLENSFPPLRTATPRPAMPTPNTPFIGRRAELAQIEKCLSDPVCRLITLAGIGGTGKTRLAIQSARQSQAFQGRACFASLAAFTTLDDLIPAIAEAVKYPFRSSLATTLALSDAKTQLLNYLADKQLLLVLDNFEQLVGCATFLVEILENAPEIKLLVTSRERLNLPGEWVMEVIGLEYPGKQERDSIPQFDAVQLFVQVAERSGRFAPSENDWPAIARVCQLLEGMPLGIEIAATWTKMLSCQEIGAEIERSLDFLTASWRGMPERHQTLRLVFDYSWRTLSETEKAAFCKLSLFQVGFTREAAFEVAGASLPILTTLADKSFVRRVSSGRFDTHPVLRQYAAEKLAEQSETQASTQARYAAYFGEWLRCLYEKLKGSEQRSALATLQMEAQNLRLARQILLKQRTFQQIELVLPAFLLFDVMNDQQVEAREMTQWLLALDDAIQEQKTTPDELSWTGLHALTLAALKWRMPQSERSADYLHASLQMAEGLPNNDGKAYVFLLNSIGAGGSISPQEAIDLCQRSMAIFQYIHDDWGEALSQLILADTANFGKLDAELAHQMYQTSLSIFAKLQNDWGQALCYAGLTFLEHSMGNKESAYQIGQQCLEWLFRIRNFERLLEIRHLLGEIAIALGKPVEAKQHFRCNLAYFLQIGDQSRINYYTERLSRMNVHRAMG